MTTAVHALESSGIGRAMRESLWLYPSVETVHIIGLAIVYGSIVVVDLRLMGISRTLSAAKLARFALPWTVGAFLVVMLTGSLMFTAHAEDFLGNGVFLLKMGLILAAGVNAGLLHAGAFRHVNSWDEGVLPPIGVRVAAALSIVLWTCVIACGRLLAYT